jgi:hypothetical protein
LLKFIKLYSEHPNTGLFGIEMIIFRTLFGSGFQMVTKWQTIWKLNDLSGIQMVGHFVTIWKPDRTFFNR